MELFGITAETGVEMAISGHGEDVLCGDPGDGPALDLGWGEDCEESRTADGSDEDVETESVPVGGGDPERLFSSDVRVTSALTREEEDELARKIVGARKKICKLLARWRALNRKALAGSGRGSISPEECFREMEVVKILNYAKEELRKSGKGRIAGTKRKELQGFVRALSSFLNDYRVLRDRMMVANLRLVILFARKHRHPCLTFLDFVQEGSLGLIRAIEKYEPGRNVKFSTYAAYWIWQQIARAADTQGVLIRTPVHWNQVRRRLGREVQRGVAEKDRERITAEWALEHGIERGRLETMSRSFQCISMDAPLSEGDDRSLEEQLPARGPAPEQEVMSADLRERMDALVDRLPSREAEIMRRRFGLANRESETLESVGARFGVSRERIRQIERRALRNLRELCTAEGLQDYLA